MWGSTLRSRQRNLPLWCQNLLKRFIPADFIYIIKRTWQTSPNVICIVLLSSFIINLLLLAFPITLLQTYDRIIPNQSIHTLLFLTIGVAIALVLEAFLKVARAYTSAWFDAKRDHLTGYHAFCHLMKCSVAEYLKIGVGELLERLNAFNNLRDFYSGQVLIALIDLPFVIIFLLLIYIIGGSLVLVPILTLSYFIYFTINYGKKVQPLIRSRTSQDDTRLNFIVETFSYIHTIKSIGMESQMQRRYERLQWANRINDKKITLINSKNNAVGMGITQVTIVMLVAVGSRMAINGHLTIGSLATCVLLAMRCTQPINRAINLYSRLQNIKVAEEEIQKVLQMPIESSEKLPHIPNLQGSITLKNITFRYNKKQPWLFQNLQLTIKENEVIGIKSRGSSGKSSLLYLIMGLYLPNEGQVLLDGQDITHFQLRSIRQKIAYLPSEGHLFKGTIMENLTKFQEEKYYNEAKRIVRQLGFETVIQSMPDGYNTMLGEQVINTLSRGIKQRIIIARELIAQPKIILFDEANTAMDFQGDKYLKETLSKLINKCTIILVSHRPSLLSLSQRIYKIEEGRLVQL